MSKTEKQDQCEEAQLPEEEQETASVPPAEEGEQEISLETLSALQEELQQKEDSYLRLAAEYDNYRKRTAKEKERLWSDGKAEAALAFLPVYDNLARALKQETQDEAFKKGVEMTMTQLKAVLNKLGITEMDALGKPFDPSMHNAVMHIEDESLGENIVAEVFESGFQMGEKVVRFAMVKVAN